MDPLVGTWQGSRDNKTYTFFVTKITRKGKYSTNSFDELAVRHYIVDNSTGTILEDSRNGGKLYISAEYFRPEDRSDYELNYYGANSRCGEKGWIRLKPLSPTTVRFAYSPNPLDLRRREECPGGVYVYKSLFPEYVDLILTKLDDAVVKTQLLKALTLTPKTNIYYQSDFGQDNISEINYPSDIENSNIGGLLTSLVSEDENAYSASSNCAKYLTEYKSKTENSNLVSLTKTILGSSCKLSFAKQYEVFNLFETDYGVVYNINIKKNSYVISKINTFIAANASCGYTVNNIKSYLIFDNNKPKLLIVKDSVCNATIDLDVSQLEFVFTDTSVNLIKTNTFIVD
jgi:hypothetical protein